MPTVESFKSAGKTNLLLTGASGSGKSTLSMFAPQPIATLLFDKDTPSLPPSVDGKGIYFKSYPPAEVELSKDSYMRARNIADAVIEDVQTVKNHFVRRARDQKFRDEQQPLKLKMMDGSAEEWPTPATVVLEGAAPIAQHLLNRILTIHKKATVDEFTNRFQPYDLRLQASLDLYDQLLRLPCNVILTTWPNDETKSEKINGKIESVKTGIIRPALGGKLDVEGPGKFDSSLFCFTDAGRFYVRTRNNSKFQGFKLGGRYGEDEIVEVTLDPKKPVNPWERLFG